MKYTIIIPHHNSSKLLKRVLLTIPESLKAQIIVVDDNSREEEYSHVERLKSVVSFDFYKNEGCTAGGARNTGLKYAIGEWLIFADSDDYFTSEMANLVETHVLSKADVIFFNVRSVVSETGDRAHRDSHIKNLIAKYKYSGDDNFVRCSYLVPWGKMYRRKFIEENNIRFEERTAGNDMWFALRSGVEASSVEIDSRELYVCTVSSGTITTTLSIDRHEAKFQATLKTNNYLRKHGLGKYQVSVLYFVAKAKQFGWGYLGHVLMECVRNKSNFLIGAKKILQYKKVLQDRQNPIFTRLKEKSFGQGENRVKYMLFPRKKNSNGANVLAVCFPAFAGVGAKYNYVRTLSDVNIHKLYLLDDIGGKKDLGNYLIKEGVEENVRALIQQGINEYHPEKLIFFGSSKGGYASINFALDFENVEVCIAAPQYFLADYLTCEKKFDNLCAILEGDESDEAKEKLNNRLRRKIAGSSLIPKNLYIHYSKNEHTYKEHIEDMLADLKNAGVNVHEDVGVYTNHMDLVYYFPSYLKSVVSHIVNS